MDRIAHRRSWIVGIVFLLLLLSVAVTVGSQPSVRSTLGIQPSAALPVPVPVESISNSLVQPTQPSRALSFEERVECQRRIEELRWRYTIWPEANPTPKPALSEVLSDEALRSKVEDALRKSSALEEYWQRPITAAQLQAEMERMARGTRHAELLLDLFAALDNDPFLIAECLARPVLSDRLLRNWYAYDSRFHGDVGAAAEAAMAGGVTAAELPAVAEKYEEVTFEKAGFEDMDPPNVDRGALRLAAEEWSEELRRLAGRFGLGRTAEPQGREFGGAVSETAVDTSDEIEALYAEIPVGEVSVLEETADGWRAVTVLSKAEGSIRLGIAQWPKLAFSTWWAVARDDLASGVEPLAGAYTVATVTGDGGCTPDTWRISVHGPPLPRWRHTAVWTGARMIVWGGRGGGNTGGVYDPGTDSWTPTSVDGAPSGRGGHTAVWTGDRMIVWGGGYTNTGYVYDPGTDSWTPTSVEGAPSGRGGHTAVWTGDRMIVWGGVTTDGSTNTGGVYDPGTDSWTPTSVDGAPSEREEHTAVWTGDRMIVWGGYPHTNTGGVYDQDTDSWTPTSLEGAPYERDGHTAVWTGDRMIVWGGGVIYATTNTGGVYDPGTDSWTPTSLEGAPSARRAHTAVWTGDRMIVWGGGTFVYSFETNTGGVYDPGTDSWTPTSVEGAPSARRYHSAVWTGARMIVWGGGEGVGTPWGHYLVSTYTGGVYDPGTDSWTPTSVEGAPSIRSRHTAVWTGARMIVWGGAETGYPAYDTTNTGGVYDPGTDSWTPTSVGDAPSGRSGHTAVWTGDRMIVWGGYAEGHLNTGGSYDPGTDSWTPTAVDGAPSGREYHTAVWTGDRMIVWGGGTNTGGVYDPGADSWTPTSVEDAPSRRQEHTAVWTGDRMIVWGGNGDGYLNTGGVYDPGTDSWTPTSVEDAPSRRQEHTAVWTGDRMIVWGGDGDGYLNTGGVYDPGTDSWTPTSLEGAPSPRRGHTAVWSGDRMIVWGGREEFRVGTNTGGVYDPGTDSWTPTSLEGAPTERESHTAIYTGSEMIIWGGNPLSNQLGSYCVLPAPIFTNPECGSTIHVEPGETVEFTVTAEDSPARTVTLDASELPPDATMDPTLPITGNPVSSQFNWTTDLSDSNTIHVLEFTAINDLLAYARCEVTIDLTVPPPSFTSPECGSTIHVEPGETVEFTVTAEDSPLRTVTLDASGLPPDAIVDPALPTTGNPVSSQFSWTTDVSDVNTFHVVEFTATSDAGSYARCEVTIDLTVPPPIFTSPECGSTIHVEPGETIAFAVAAEDSPERTITLDGFGLPPGAILDPALPITGNPVSSNFSWTMDDSPNNHLYIVEFTATNDLMAYARCEVTIEIPPPIFINYGCGSTARVEPGETIAFTLIAEDAPERSVTLDASGLPPGAIMDPALPTTGNPVSSMFTWTTDDSHDNTGHIVEFTATNEFGSYARCRVGIEVGDYTLPPIFTSPECESTIYVEPGETVEFAVTADDAPERTVTLDASGLPPNAILDPALPITGNPVLSMFTWTTDVSHNNTGHIVEFTATNEFGSYARCRVGIEVGDYTLVTLVSFTAIPGDGQVTLHWTTASEIDNAGFYLLRSTVAARGTVRLHKGLIPAKGDVFTGADYTYVDETAINGVEYEYTLVDVDLYGTETRHPPVRAIPNPPDPPVKHTFRYAER